MGPACGERVILPDPSCHPVVSAAQKATLCDVLPPDDPDFLGVAARFCGDVAQPAAAAAGASGERKC